MTLIGYHASHEQFAPSDLLNLVVEAERAGFSCAKSSDHFHPWSERQGQSGFAWSWLGAAMQATRFGLGMISAPGYRYHPAVLAQAAATVGEMFPGPTLAITRHRRGHQRGDNRRILAGKSRAQRPAA